MLHLKHSVNKLSFISRQLTTSISRLASSSSKTPENLEEIKIPLYIKRTPTDILKALSSTVAFDPTAPHYKYHDDPFLIPTSNAQKRIYAMAQESGRKSAKFIRQEHAELFQHKEMDPPIEAFIPTKTYNEESTVEIKDLEKLIENSEVSDAILVFKLLQSNKVEVSKELKESFFEMICFYNCEDPLDEDLMEERWFRQTEKGKERSRNTWKDGEIADSMFSDMEVKDAKAYSAYIRGMLKYYQVEKAYAIFQDAQAKNIQLDVECYNALINRSNFIKESTELRWEFVNEVLNLMKTNNVEPNLGTLNSCLNAVRQMAGKPIREYCLSVLSEFKQIGIEPSLASWFYVLHIFCRERAPVSHVLLDIMREIEGKEFKIRDPQDTQFFLTAMENARLHLNDVNLARRVYDLLHFGENYNLIGDSFRESVFYRHYFLTLIANEPLDSIMETYNLLVPNVYVPEPAVMEELLKVVEVAGAVEHVPFLISNIVQFDHIARESILNSVMRIMVQNPPVAGIPNHEGLTEKFAVAAHDLFLRIEEKNENRRTIIVQWTGQLLGDFLSIVCDHGNFEKSTEIFNKIVNEQKNILGEPDVTALQKYIQVCIASKQPNNAILCLQLANDIGFTETAQMAKDIVKGFTLDGLMLRRIIGIVGLEIVEDAENEKQKIRELKLKEFKNNQK